MSAFSLRPARPDDVPDIAAVYEHAVLHGTATYELEPPTEAEMLTRFQGITGAGYPYLVAEDAAGQVLGYGYGGPFRTRPAYRWTVEDSIYLAPSAQGQGVGTALLLRLVELCEAAGFRQMIAVIGGSDNFGSLRIHAKAGFRPAGTLEASGFKFGRWIDTVLMQRPLGEGAATLPEGAASAAPD